MKKSIPELAGKNVNKEDILKITQQILDNPNYFKEYDINSLSARNSNLLHFALSYKNQILINKILNENIDLFKQNKVGMYPIFYTKSMQDFKTLINHPSIKENQQTIKKLKDLLFNDLVSPVYYWKPKKFKEFLTENKEMLSYLNDDSITFMLNINQLLSVDLHEVWEKFKEENNIEFSSKEVYFYIIDKVKDNKNLLYKSDEWNNRDNERLEQFKKHSDLLLKTLKEGFENHNLLKKIPKLKMDTHKDFYLMQSPEYEQLEFLYKEIQLLKLSLKKGSIEHIEKELFKEELLFQWRDYLNKEKISQEDLKSLCEENGLLGISISPVFSLSFINKLIADLRKETLKVFPMQDSKLFAENAYLKISNMFGKNNGYLHYSRDKNVLNINVSDYSHGRENIFAEELKDLKNCFVHEYTHYLQVVSEYHYDLNFQTSQEWLKIEDKILREFHSNENLENKLKEVMLKEFERNAFDFSDNNKLNQYLEEVINQKDIQEIKNIAHKLLLLCPKFQRSLDHKKYMVTNLEFMHNCISHRDKNLQKLYLDKLNKDDYLEDYYDDPVELHARLNEHLIKINGKELIKDFSFLSEEDNNQKKKLVMKDLKKFNALICNHLEKLKEKKKNNNSMQ